MPVYGAGGVVLCCMVLAAAAEPVAPLSVGDERKLQLVALGKARTELLDRVRALPLGRDLSVGDWVAGDADFDRGLRLWARTRPRQGSARVYSDAVCEIDVSAGPEELLDELLRLREEHAATPAVARMSVELVKAAAASWPTLWVTGTGSLARRLDPNRPAGWENVTTEGMELAAAAARADALHALLEEAGRLKVTHARRLHEFLDSSAEVRSAMQGELQREGRATVALEPDQVAVATATISLRDLLRMLTRVHEQHYAGDQFVAADFREMTLLAGRDDLKATGLATPPERTVLRNRYAPIEYNAPDWAGRTLTATGRHRAADEESASRAAQLEAARIDGIDQLRQKTEKLVLQQAVTVGEFLGYHQDLKSDMVLWLSGAHPRGAARSGADGGFEVDVELSLRRLWEILRRGMKLEEVEPAENAPSSAPAPAKESP